MNLIKLKWPRTIFLLPISRLWEAVYAIRRKLYEYGFLKQYSFQTPIISVGNLTFGGTGKTPVTIWLAEYVEQLKSRPLVLMRGYKGQLEKSAGYLEGGKNFKFNPIQYGDEALLIAKRLHSGGVVVGRDRTANLKFYYNQILPDVVILDDGFQHLKLARKLNFVLFDALLPLSRYKVAPCGYLREGPSALKDADAIIISRSDQVTPQKISELKTFVRKYTPKDIPVAEIKYAPVGIFNCLFEKVYDIDDIVGRDVIAVAALASPESFYKLLEGMGANIVERLSFADHYYFTESDTEEFITKAKRKKALVISSEKDMVKLRKVAMDANFLYLEIKVEFMSGEREIKEKISSTIHQG